VSQQKAAEERETYWLMQNRLLSITFLGKFTKAQLRLMRNEILARRGWVFQSKDLKEYFGSQSWYHPLGNNYSTKISLLEQTNVQLITNEEILSDKDRVGPVKTDVAQATTKPVQQKPVVDVPKKVEEEPKKVEEATKPVVEVPKKAEQTSNRPEPADNQLVFVANEEQFLNALGNNRVVEISANAHLNLSAFLEQENLFHPKFVNML
jgi:hypothetical protein